MIKRVDEVMPKGYDGTEVNEDTEYEEITVTYLHDSGEAILIHPSGIAKDDVDGQEVWIPRSLIRDTTIFDQSHKRGDVIELEVAVFFLEANDLV